MKKGILVVSFGTSHLDTMEKTIDVIEKERRSLKASAFTALSRAG